MVVMVIASFVAGAIVGAIVYRNAIRHNIDKIHKVEKLAKDVANDIQQVKNDISQIKN